MRWDAHRGALEWRLVGSEAVRRILKWCAVVLGGSLVCAAVAVVVLLQSEGGKEFLERSANEARKFVGWRWFLFRIGVDDLVRAERALPETTSFGGLKFSYSRRRTWRGADRRTSVSVELVGAKRITQLRLLVGVDRNGNGQIDPNEWSLVATAGQDREPPATMLSIPEVAIDDDVIAERFEVDGEPFGSTFVEWTT